MKIISLGYNRITQNYFLADAPTIFTERREETQNLNHLITLLGKKIEPKRQMTLRIFKDFPKEDLEKIKSRFANYQKLYYEYFEPE